jgi:hypothetical protein
MAKRLGKNQQATAVGQLIAGFKKHFPNGTDKVTLGPSASPTVDQLTSELQAFIGNRAAVVAAQANARAKVDAEQTQMASLLALISATVAFVRFTFGNSADVLADFGVAPIKTRTPMTAEEKAVAVAKRAATRKARGTTGPRAKKGVKGAVNATLVVTPAEAPAQQAAPPAQQPQPKQS